MKFALVGNPNSGKTTLFNALTGSTAHVGNWPGVTIEKRIGTYKKLSEKIEIVDLPGIYSLSPYTPEEAITRNYVLDEKPDCIINIVDATNLERNLYLTTQLLELDIPVVVALNMCDVVEKAGDKINISKLEKELSIPAVEISALKSTGIKELMQRCYEATKLTRIGFSVLQHSSVAQLYNKVLDLFKNTPNAAFHAVKLIEADQPEEQMHPDIAKQVRTLKETADTGIFNGDYEGVVADARYKYIESNYIPSLTKTLPKNALTKSDKIDRVLTHKLWGIPIFLAIMLFVFHLTFSENLFFIGNFIPEGSFDIAVLGTDSINSPGVMLFNAITMLCSMAGDAVSSIMPQGTWYTSLICDGILEGLFAVISFIPQILVLFLFLTILEDSGYMARVAFIMDRAFRKLGLSGKAFMPLVMCFGCAVPGIMATRTLEDEKERRRTIMITPFFSCGAKLPIWAAFAGVFSAAYTGLSSEIIVYSMYLLGIFIAIVASLFLKKTVVKGDVPPFIMELPSYHTPQLRNIVVRLWEKLKHFVIKAATVIVGAIIVIWFLSTFSWSLQMVDNSELSILGTIGKALSWLFIPLGFGMGENGWKFVVAAITGLIAKEMVVATIGTFAGMSEDEIFDSNIANPAQSTLGVMMLTIGGTIGGLSVAIPAMFSFLAFNLLSVPCMSAVAATRGELKARKHFWLAVSFWLTTSYVVSLVIFWGGVLFTLCWWAGLIAVAALVACLFLLVKFKNINKKELL